MISASDLTQFILAQNDQTKARIAVGISHVYAFGDELYVSPNPATENDPTVVYAPAQSKYYDWISYHIPAARHSCSKNTGKQDPTPLDLVTCYQSAWLLAAILESDLPNGAIEALALIRAREEQEAA